MERHDGQADDGAASNPAPPNAGAPGATPDDEAGPAPSDDPTSAPAAGDASPPDDPVARDASPPDDPATAPPDDPAAALAELEQRSQRYLANWQRAQADLQNLRKQVEQERDELTQWAAASLMEQLLPVLDDLERAFATIPPSLHGFTWIEGVWFVAKKLESVLASRGLEPVAAAAGDAFDPRRHQAIAEVDGPADRIVEVVQRGYTVGPRLLRPTLVTVGNATTVDDADGGGDGGGGGGDGDEGGDATDDEGAPAA